MHFLYMLLQRSPLFIKSCKLPGFGIVLQLLLSSMNSNRTSTDYSALKIRISSAVDRAQVSYECAFLWGEIIMMLQVLYDI